MVRTGSNEDVMATPDSESGRVVVVIFVAEVVLVLFVVVDVDYVVV